MTEKTNEVEKHNKGQREYYEKRTIDANVRVVPTLSRYVSRHVDRLIGFGGLSAGERILDIGCGMGKYTIPLAMKGLGIEGLDLSPYLLEELATHNESGRPITTYCTDLLEYLPELESSFDAVTGFFMLHHMVDLRATFEAVHYYLKPGGRMVFLDANALNPLYYLQITLAPTMSWRAEKGLLSLTKKKLASAAWKAGFGECETERFGMLPPFLMNSPVGPSLEGGIDSLPFIRPFSAFQMFKARKV